jgi:hypothetical protein
MVGNFSLVFQYAIGRSVSSPLNVVAGWFVAIVLSYLANIAKEAARQPFQTMTESIASPFLSTVLVSNSHQTGPQSTHMRFLGPES